MITIVTATYNRRHLLMRLFASLQLQGQRDIEWIIVDDGGSDGTHAIVEELQQQAHFVIRYIYQQNSGKAAAVNRGIALASGDLVSVIDDDDYFLPGMFSVIDNDYAEIINNADLVGLSYLTVDSELRIRGKKFPRNRMVSDHYDCRVNMKIVGDKCEFIKTRVLQCGGICFKTNGRPGMGGDTRFLLRVADRGKTLYVNTPVLVKDFREDGITVNWRRRCLMNPEDTATYYAAHLNRRVRLSIRGRYMTAYIAIVLYGGLKVDPSYLKPFANRLFYILCYLPGVLCAMKWKLRCNRVLSAHIHHDL